MDKFSDRLKVNEPVQFHTNISVEEMRIDRANHAERIYSWSTFPDG